MAGLGFKPTLGQITEESHLSDFDESLLDDYAVLSEHDLLKALDLHEDCQDCNHGSESDTSRSIMDFTDDTEGALKQKNSDFESMHSNTKFKNQSILEKYSVKPDIDRDSIYNDEHHVTRTSQEHLDEERIPTDHEIQHRGTPTTHYLEMTSSSDEITDMFVCGHENVFNTVTGIDFLSDLGKKIFMRAVNQKYMNIYYVLSMQHIFPLHPPNEGISTLVMIVNALKTEHDLYSYKSSNLDFDDFACLSRDSGISVQAIRLSHTATMDDFRKTVKSSAASNGSIVVCYYAKDNQCTGHYFIISGYCKDRDLLLVMNISSSPRWLPLQEMWKVLSETHVKTDQNIEYNERTNGYMVLEKAVESPSITVSINQKASIKLESNTAINISHKLLCLKTEWNNWLSHVAVGSEEEALKTCVKHMISIIANSKYSDGKEEKASTNENTKLSYKQGSLVDSVTKTKVFSIVQDIISSAPPEELLKLNQFSEWILDVMFVTKKPKQEKRILTKSIKRKKKALVKTHVNINLFNNAAMLSTWLIFWPYKKEIATIEQDTNSSLLQEFLKHDIETFPMSVVVLFHEQIAFVLKALHHSQKLKDQT